MAMSRPPPSLPIRLPKEPGGTLSRQDCGNGLQEPSSFRPGDIFSMDGHVGCASVPAETAALSSRTLRPRQVKPIVKAAACSSAHSIPRVMRIRIVRLIGLQNALCSGTRDGAQGIRRSCCPIRFMGSCLRIRIQDCFSGMIFYRIKKVFEDNSRRRCCKWRIENGEWRITQR